MNLLREMLRPLARLGLAAVAMGAGCQRSGVQDASEPRGQLVRVALSFTLVRGEQTPRFEGQGHFARYALSDADRVPALLGLPDDDSIPLDSCRLIDSAHELDKALAGPGEGADVRLLDAGRLVARGPSDTITLVPRHYPELIPFVTGVVYGNEDGLPLALQPGGTYEVSGEGGEAVGPFTAQVQAPRAFPALEVPTFRRGEELEIKWAEAGEASEPAMLTVTWSTRGEAREVRCRVRDDGSFTVGRAELAGMPAASQLTSSEVALTRSRRAPIVAPGAVPGELRLSLREVVALPVSSGPASVPTPSVPVVPAEGER